MKCLVNQTCQGKALSLLTKLPSISTYKLTSIYRMLLSLSLFLCDKKKTSPLRLNILNKPRHMFAWSPIASSGCSALHTFRLHRMPIYMCSGSAIIDWGKVFVADTSQWIAKSCKALCDASGRHQRPNHGDQPTAWIIIQRLMTATIIMIAKRSSFCFLLLLLLLLLLENSIS